MNGALSYSAKWEEFRFGIVLMGQCVLMHDLALYDERNSYGIDEFTMKINEKELYEIYFLQVQLIKGC